MAATVEVAILPLSRERAVAPSASHMPVRPAPSSEHDEVRPIVVPEHGFLAPGPLAAPAAGAASPMPAPARPHDFATLIDRIAAARDAAQPQAVTVAVSHAEFGAVRMQFRHQDGALSVALTSADPDFARAVAAAPPIVPAAPDIDAAFNQAFQPGSRGSEPQGFAQDRGQPQPERRDERWTRDNPAPARQARSDDAPRSGIFA